MQNKNIKYPIAQKKPKSITQFGDTRIDNYYWMRLSDEQKNSPNPDNDTRDVLDYLHAENDYTNQQMASTETLQDKIYNEIVSRIDPTEISVPYLSNEYFYITRFEAGKEYPIYSRKYKSLNANEEILLDVNELAANHSYYNIAGRNVSPNNKILAYGEDTVSRRIYTIRFKDLETGECYDDIIENTTGSITWANDNKTVFYNRKDDALRSFKIFKHILGTDQQQDIEIYHEKDETFSCYVSKTKSKKYIVISSIATLSQAYQILDADNPEGTFNLFHPRETKLEYDIAHYENQWYIRTNKDKAYNFKLMTTSINNTSKNNWKEYIPHNENIYLEEIDIFKNFIALSLRENGNTQIKIINNNDSSFYIPFDEEVYSVWTSINLEFNTNLLRISYTSLTTPLTTYDFDINTKERILLKQQKVIGGYAKDQYIAEKIFVTAKDGTEIPLSIVYKKAYKKDGNGPLLLYSYGSYGLSTDPYFSSVRLSLLDRGFAFAIAHIRGGQEKGRMWYEGGKFLNKKNTFTDFIACGQYLVDHLYTSKSHLYAMGGSAGGLLMGAVMNMAPSLWNGVVAAVPFVDVLTTMLDETIPLTTGEFSEWGNPKEESYYNYIKSYSPYDNISSKDYPATLITTGFFDSQVQYWEPAKWLAKLRDLKTDNHLLLMHCDMKVGHGGASGRFAKYKETALEYAFLLFLESQLE